MTIWNFEILAFETVNRVSSLTNPSNSGMPSAIVKERPRSIFPKGFLAIRTMFFLTHKVEHLTSALPVRSMLWVVTFCLLGGWLGFVEVFGASTDPPGIPQRCCSSPPKVDEASSPQHSSLFRQMHGWPTTWANGIPPKMSAENRKAHPTTWNALQTFPKGLSLLSGSCDGMLARGPVDGE